MKKHQSYWVLLLAVLISGTVSAKVDSYVGAYANVGEWSLIPTQSKYGTSFGAAGGLGFLYELQAGPTYGQTRFLFDIGVGADYGMTSFMQGSNAKVTLENQEDMQGDVFDYVYEIQDRKDQYANLALRVPIMFGVQHRQFYMMAGVKIGANLMVDAYTTANVRTYGNYHDFDPYYNMPEYQFFNQIALEKKQKAGSVEMVNLDLSFEIGGRIGYLTDAIGYDVPKRKIEYRLAAFIDYGVLDFHKAGVNDFFSAPDYYDPVTTYKATTMIDNLEVNDIMSTQSKDENNNVVPFAKSVNNLMVGLKFTVLFQLPEAGKCVICRDAYRSSASGRGGRRGMKYEEYLVFLHFPNRTFRGHGNMAGLFRHHNTSGVGFFC